jgi:DNA-binding NarL/FixJ family response regulator
MMAIDGWTERNRHRILIVDDHPIVRRGLRELVADETDLVVCGEAEDLAEAMRQVEATRPDVVVVDLTLKGGHGLDLIQEIKARFGHIKMLVSSMHDESLFAERALRAGASGYISKQESPERIIDALRQVLRGEVYLSSRMSNRLLHRLSGGEKLEKDPIASLSDRELEVFEMIGQGLSTKQIARKLNLSHKTIETHREKIKAKLDLKNSAELSRHATQWVLQNG